MAEKSSIKSSDESDGDLNEQIDAIEFCADSHSFDSQTSMKFCDLKKLTAEICRKIPLDSTPFDEKEFRSVILPTDNSQRWGKIRSALEDFARRPLHQEFHATILKYNEDRKGQLCSFDKYRLHPSVDKDEFNSLLGEVARRALMLPQLVDRPFRALVKGKDQRVTLTAAQMSSLLANAFFCTFPEIKNPRHYHGNQYTRERGSHGRGHGRGSINSTNHSISAKDGTCRMPTFNFLGLFAGVAKRGQHDDLGVEMKSEKLKCILHYFKKIFTSTAHDIRRVTFHRHHLKTLPRWRDSKMSLSRVEVCSGGNIEDAHSLLQVDFANKMVGGGVLGRGCVQEEIRFVICPELIVSRLVTEELDDDECLIVTGVERFSKYSGYSKSFKWRGDYSDDTPTDDQGRRLTQVVVMDALKFLNEKSQFHRVPFVRELNKAFCGFSSADIAENERPAVATGNWGCGAFKGNKELKFVAQLLAASESSRQTCYMTFNDATLGRRILDFCQRLESCNVNVGELYSMVDKALSAGIPQNFASGVQFFDCLIVRKNDHQSLQPSEGSIASKELLDGWME